MTIQNIKSTNFDLTAAIKSYVEKRMGELDRVLTHLGQPQEARVEIGKISNHHKKGDIFRFEINLKVFALFFLGYFSLPDYKRYLFSLECAA